MRVMISGGRQGLHQKKMILEIDLPLQLVSRNCWRHHSFLERQNIVALILSQANILQLTGLTLSQLQRIPETFRRRPDQPAKSCSEMTLACKAGSQRDLGDRQVCF